MKPGLHMVARRCIGIKLGRDPRFQHVGAMHSLSDLLQLPNVFSRNLNGNPDALTDFSLEVMSRSPISLRLLIGRMENEERAAPQAASGQRDFSRVERP